ncbi:hypothetical protein SLS56_002315 [Neofusicoccum ribis]|uniref:Uncharacterized protein n=1 Tax=Neofusicoccum ribis TaxID=45134 RepID=A0ABR3T467_9PEZI
MGIWGDKRVTYPPNMFSIMQDDCNGLDVDFRELKTIKSMDEPVLKDLNVLHSTTREVAEDLLESLHTIDTASRSLNSGLEEATTDYLQRIEEAEREITDAKAGSLRRIEEAEQEVRVARLESLQRLLKAEHDILQALVRIRQMEQEIAGQRLNAPPCRLRKVKKELGRVKARLWSQEKENTLGTPGGQRHEARKTQEALEAELAWLERLCRSRMARADGMGRDATTLTGLLRFCEVS